MQHRRKARRLTNPSVEVRLCGADEESNGMAIHARQDIVSLDNGVDCC